MNMSNKGCIEWKRILALAPIAIGLLLTSPTAKADNTGEMEDEGPRTDVALALVAAWNTHDADKVAALFTPDAVTRIYLSVR